MRLGKYLPDFPKTSGATAAEVWANATRTLSAFTGQPRTDLVGADNAIWANATRTLSAFTGTPRTDLIGADQSLTTQGYTSVRATKIDNLDATVSSRSTLVATDVWAAATRTLSAFTGQPRIDVLGEDATFEAGTGARKVRIDKIPAAVAPVETSILMNGTEQNLVEVTDVKVGTIESWVDLTPMLAGDTIVVRYYKKVKAAGAYVKYAEESYSGVQTLPLLCILKKMSYRDTKVSAQQTLGTNRTLDIQTIRTVEA